MGGPGSGRKKGGGKTSNKKAETFSVSTSKMKNKPIPVNLKKKWSKSGGVNNPEYKAWVKKNWKS